MIVIDGDVMFALSVVQACKFRRVSAEDVIGSPSALIFRPARKGRYMHMLSCMHRYRCGYLAHCGINIVSNLLSVRM